MRDAPHRPTVKLRSAEAQLFDALAFAARKHRDQRRKDAHASPYINHPIALAHLLSVEGGVTDTRTLIAAVLHDTIEDTETSYDELRRCFGKVVADVVAELTDDKALPKAERKHLQVVHAPHKTRRAAFVKLADKTWNLRDMADNPPVGWSLERRREYFDWAKRVVDGLPPVSKRLRRVFDAAYARRP